MTRRTVRDIADAAGAEMTSRTKAHTPVDTGKTRDSWRQIDVHEPSPGEYVTGTESSYYKARWVEHGVRPHDLRSRRQRAKDVEPIRHPGHAGAHPLAKATAEVEAALDTIAKPALTEWQTEVERLGGTRRNR